MKTLEEITHAVSLGMPFGSDETPLDVYHDRRCPGVSKSRLDLVRKSPAHFKAWLDGEEEEKESDSLDFGSALHTLLLEPHLFDSQFVRLPDGMRNDPRTAAFKAWFSENQGKTILSAPDWDAVYGIQRTILANPEVAMYLDRSVPKKIEYSIWWIDPSTGLWCKARLDLWVAGSVILDFKTTRDASPDAFSKSIGNFKYHVQAAMQIDAVIALGGLTDHYLYVAVEKTKPYLAPVYRLLGEEISLGRRIYQRDLERIKRAQESVRYEGYFSGIQDIRLRPWEYELA